jgi:hypothetical protein
MTLLFQDSVGGLEVMTKSQGWQVVKPIEGAIGTYIEGQWIGDPCQPCSRRSEIVCYRVDMDLQFNRVAMHVVTLFSGKYRRLDAALDQWLILLHDPQSSPHITWQNSIFYRFFCPSPWRLQCGMYRPWEEAQVRANHRWRIFGRETKGNVLIIVWKKLESPDRLSH